MWKFKAEQKEFNIGRVKIGGIPGERPTVLIGTIFYYKHKVLIDENAGEFDRKLAEELINLQEEFADKTGNPCMLDVVGSSLEAMRKFLDFTADITDTPILIDSPSMDVRVTGLEYAKEKGLMERVIYNSLTPEFKQEELEKLKEVGVKNAVLLAYYSKEFTSGGRVKAIKELLPIVYKAGIEKPLVDTCVIDVPSFSQACRALFDLKNELGVPTGCGPHNAIATWRGLRRKMGKQAVKPCTASIAAAAATVGADFILYGPIEDAEYVFPAVAMIDAACSQLLVEERRKPYIGHPRYKIG